MKYFVDKQTRREGWEGRYRTYIDHLEKMNYFPDLEKYYRKEKLRALRNMKPARLAAENSHRVLYAGPPL